MGNNSGTTMKTVGEAYRAHGVATLSFCGCRPVLFNRQAGKRQCVLSKGRLEWCTSSDVRTVGALQC